MTTIFSYTPERLAKVGLRRNESKSKKEKKRRKEKRREREKNPLRKEASY